VTNNSFLGIPLSRMALPTGSSVPYLYVAGFYQPVPLLETVGHLCVHFRRINMAIAGLDGFLDGIHLCLWILPGTESESWDLGSGVELVSCARHASSNNVSLSFE
jgi:hypothetical protein